MILETDYVIIAYMGVVFFYFLFFFQFCDVVTLVIIHKEILTMFGYRLTFKVEFDLNPFYVLATCLNNV